MLNLLLSSADTDQLGERDAKETVRPTPPEIDEEEEGVPRDEAPPPPVGGTLRPG